MTFPYKSLEDNGVDVGAGVHEQFLNSFSKSHFKAVPQLYKGSVPFEDFDSRVVVSYEIHEALKFDLTPIPSARIRRVLVSHFSDSKRSNDPETYLDAFDPPNLKITGERVKVTITVFKGHTSDVDFSIDFDWGVDARCLVYFKEYTPEKKAIRLEAIKVAFVKPKAELLADIAKKLGGLRKRDETRLKVLAASAGKKAGKPLGARDDEWCLKLERLFLFLVNQVLAVQFTNFVNEWELPKAIEVTQGASITPSLLAIQDNYLIVGAQVNATISQIVTPLQSATSQLIAEFREAFDQEFATMSDDDLKIWSPERSSSLRWLKDREAQIKKDSEGRRTAARAGNFDKNLILVTNSKLIDAIARTTLAASASEGFSKKLDHLVKAEAGWWFRLGPSSGKIVNGGISVDTNAAIGGYVRGCIPDLNPKHWGDWRCEGICIELKTVGFGVEARPSFEDDGVYFRFRLKQGSAIGFDFCDAPGWLRDLLEWITSLFTRALLGVLSSVVALFKFKLLDYPQHFPGTGLDWTPRLNRTMTNERSYLELSGDPKFA